MAIFGIKSYLSVFVACIIVGTPLVQGHSLRRRHGHHSHSDYYNFEESLPRDLKSLSGRLEDDLGYYRDPYGQTRRHEQPQVPEYENRSAEYEDSEDRVPPSFRRYRHEYDSRGRESLRRREDILRRYGDLDALSMELVARRKRHNKHDGTVIYQRLNEENKKNPRLRGQRDHGLLELHYDGHGNLSFELEVKEAQNRAICNYTVESIPDLRGSRVPKDLEHVRCNHIGSRCQSTGISCCIQTYRNIEVSYGNGDRETMKLYVGCVCALQALHGAQEPQPPIHD